MSRLIYNYKQRYKNVYSPKAYAIRKDSNVVFYQFRFVFFSFCINFLKY